MLPGSAKALILALSAV